MSKDEEEWPRCMFPRRDKLAAVNLAENIDPRARLQAEASRQAAPRTSPMMSYKGA